MSEVNSGLTVVIGHASGWCDPDTGMCHTDAADETPAAEAPLENDDGDRPGPAAG